MGPITSRGEVKLTAKEFLAAVALLLNLIAGAIAYGQLAGRVEMLHEDVQQIKAILLQRNNR